MSKRKREEEDIDVKGVDADVQEPAVKKLKLDPLKLLHEKVFEDSFGFGAINDFLTATDMVRFAATEKKRRDWLKQRPELIKENRCVRCKKVFDEDLDTSDVDVNGVEYKEGKEEYFCEKCMPEKCEKCEEWFKSSQTEFRDEQGIGATFCDECVLVPCADCKERSHPDDLDCKERCSECHEDCAQCGHAHADETFDGVAYCDGCYKSVCVEYCRRNHP